MLNFEDIFLIQMKNRAQIHTYRTIIRICFHDDICHKIPPLFKNASAFLLRDARHAMHDILLLRISAILPEAISDGGLTPITDTDLLLATYRGGSHLTSDIILLLTTCRGGSHLTSDIYPGTFLFSRTNCTIFKNS